MGHSDLCKDATASHSIPSSVNRFPGHGAKLASKGAVLNLKHLYYFYVFSQERSTSRAARRLGITAPALSNQLKHLESVLGVRLTRRVEGQVTMTECGDMVLNYVNRMFSLYEELHSKLTVRSAAESTTIRVGVCRDLGARFSFDLLFLLESMTSSFSKTTVVTFGSSNHLKTQFEDGEFDIIFGSFQDLEIGKHIRLFQTLEFPVRLFAPEFFDTKEDPFEVARQRGIALIFPMEPSVLRQESEAYFLKTNIKFERTIVCNSSGAIVQLIERGAAIGFVPTPCLLDFRSAKALSSFGPTEGFWSHQISVFVRNEMKLPLNVVPSLDVLFQKDFEFK